MTTWPFFIFAMFDRKLTLMILQITALFLAAMETEAIRTLLQYDVTTMAANGTFNDTDCLCDCEELQHVNISSAPSTQEEAQRAASQLVEELKVDRSNLSSTTRRKISAPDHRPSAQGIGVVGVIVIVLVLGSIVALDFTVLVNDVKFAITRLFGYPHGQAPYRSRLPRRMRRGLRQGPTSRSFYSSPLAGPVPERGQQFHREMVELERSGGGGGDGGAGRRNLGAGVPPGMDSDVPDLRSRREFLLMHGTSRQ